MKLLGRDIHWGLILSVTLTVFLGCILIYSAVAGRMTHGGMNLAFKQLIVFAGTAFVALLIFFLDTRWIARFAWPFYFLALGLLVAVFFIGKSSHGAQRWIHLGFLNFQPSEFAKIAIILALAKYMSTHKEIHQKGSFLLMSTMLVLVPLLLILKQPDLGTSLTLIPILTVMLFMAGIQKRYFLTMIPFAVIPLFILKLAKSGNIAIETMRNLLFFLKPYQQNRVLVYIDPNLDPRGLSYNLIQSKIAIGSGGMFGNGFISGTQTQLQFIPERHTDFIFCVLGEEWGFVGGMVLLFLYFLSVRNALSIADSCVDFFPKLAAIGIVTLWITQIFINMGMTIGLMPITGLPLPLISYGGSSLMIFMIGAGLLLNFYANRDKKFYH
jgi:rod shape determining protein RodA